MKAIAKLLIMGLAVTMISPALAGKKHHRHEQNSYYDYARVINVVPVYRTVEVAVPRQSCWNEQVRQPVRRHVHNDSSEGMLVGGLIGGVIGHHLGRGGDRDMATIAGTLIGAAVGHDQGSQRVDSREYYIQDRQRCATRMDYRTEQQQDGYQVTYRYHGEIFHTHMDRRPGKRVRIAVQVAPVR